MRFNPRGAIISPHFISEFVRLHVLPVLIEVTVRVRPLYYSLQQRGADLGISRVAFIAREEESKAGARTPPLGQFRVSSPSSVQKSHPKFNLF
jgi:hypothetical protein